MTDEFARREEPMLAAIAAALLGGQGSPVWSRTAELLLLSSTHVATHRRRALAELESVLRSA